MTKLRVVVADDHQLTLSGVADSLSMNGVSIVGRARNAPDAIALVLETKPDALVSDLDFGPGPTGIDIATHLRKKLPKLGIVVLSAYGDPRLHHTSLGGAPKGVVYLIKQQSERQPRFLTPLPSPSTAPTRQRRANFPE